jgi:glycerol transport system ATP-binding protein
MARVELANVRHVHPGRGKAPGIEALKRIDQVFEAGGAYALLGRPGAGKTTLLDIVSGLVAPTEGRVMFGTEDVTARPTERRNVAQVFAAPVVYETMTVRENIDFPLRNRKTPSGEARRRADEALDMIGLIPKSNTRARDLSVGEKQKLALARGLVRSDAAVILLDEPLAMIEPRERWRLRGELRAVQRKAGLTMICATRDQTEALTFADKVAVMHEGEIVQVGSAAELFDQPRHTFVGRYVGSPGMNILSVTVEGDLARLGRQSVQLASAPNLDANVKLELGVRPEHVRVGQEGMPAEVVRVEDAGRLRIVRARVEGRDVAAVMKEGVEIPADARISFDPRGLHLYADSWRVELGRVEQEPAEAAAGA